MQTMNFMLMVRSIKRVTIMMELNCELNNGVKVKTHTAMGARYLSVYMPQVYDDLTEEGIWESLTLAKAGQIG